MNFINDKWKCFRHKSKSGSERYSSRNYISFSIEEQQSADGFVWKAAAVQRDGVLVKAALQPDITIKVRREDTDQNGAVTVQSDQLPGGRMDCSFPWHDSETVMMGRSIFGYDSCGKNIFWMQAGEASDFYIFPEGKSEQQFWSEMRAERVARFVCEIKQGSVEISTPADHRVGCKLWWNPHSICYTEGVSCRFSGSIDEALIMYLPYFLAAVVLESFLG